MGVVLGLVLWARRRSRPEGELSLIAALAYGIGRFGFDFARADVRRLGLTGSQWVALAVVLVAGAAVVYRRGRGSGIAMAPADVAGPEAGGGDSVERGSRWTGAAPDGSMRSTAQVGGSKRPRNHVPPPAMTRASIK